MPPDFTGAPCRAHVALFFRLIHVACERGLEPDDDDLSRATAVCGRCPLVEACAERRAEHKAQGFWAGRYWTAYRKSAVRARAS